jgi:hypothetical protein
MNKGMENSMDTVLLETGSRATARARRADAGAMTEMARSLLREAGESRRRATASSRQAEGETPALRLLSREATDGAVRAARRLRGETIGGEPTRVVHHLRRPGRSGGCGLDRGGSPAAA